MTYELAQVTHITGLMLVADLLDAKSNSDGCANTYAKHIALDLGKGNVMLVRMSDVELFVSHVDNSLGCCMKARFHTT